METKIKNRLRTILLIIIVAYVPLLLVLGFRYDIIGTSLSGIGWREGGLPFLLFYVAYTVPLMIYQVFLFLTLTNKKSKWLMVFSLLGGWLVAIGAVFPVKETSPQFSHLIHSYFCQIGSVLSILAVTLVIALYCKENKSSVRKVAVLYGGVIAVILVSFGILFTAALFEVGASLLLLCTIYAINNATFNNNKELLQNEN